MELTAEEIRVLGCLIEKEATTPDNYPLSTNALVNACNQSTNRDPVLSLSERAVDAAVLSLREQGLARTIRGDGQRVNKHKHVVGEALGLARKDMAVLSVLMLRGAQTAAELRARTERYEVGLDLATTEALLAQMAGAGEPLVRQLARRPGERESRWIQLLGPPGEDSAPALSSATGGEGLGSGEGRPAPLGSRVEALEAQVAAQQRQLDALAAQLERLAVELGADP